ncbi:glycine betaine ABC transporter substrate-binding protein [Cryobacterium levicorallinum]|uniref:Glycine betaine ABC transporter substrate-binding protein n=1 Tax=Cryobacterium levicorallinum TaxID=995038 RepID=A0A1I3EJF3_9MICO|nr:glycine betaine ABC transporter substrate-binding protein [Cryobacterium levicorallinum]TFB86346.1 glycine betaine ABC transporter substrate-binding protein [Cryobacterium levicorallinum]GEP28781.1 glycine/betaine ABC transporter substrate-binding protein [Cryobacterium levicorallinum]SFH99099.1 osmoprotectant transport system substrate-binding protein [Cryobacterium levicorallinum]
MYRTSSQTRPRAHRGPLGRWGLATGILALSAVALTGCGLQPATSYVPAVGPGSITPLDGADGVNLTVTSKNFTEQLLLGKIAVLAGTAAGFDVTDLSNVPGSQPARELLLSGQADVLWDYTGTAWLTYLGQAEVITDQDEMWQAVYDLDIKNGVTWGAPAPMNNTYALAVRSESVANLGNITAMSELAALPVADRTFCIEAEFNSRPDGLNPMLAHYGLERGTAHGVPDSNIGIYDTGAIYSATDNGACNFGEVFTTDGRLDALDLTVLTDDRAFFPAYNVAPIFFTETIKAHPGLEKIFAEISPNLTDEVLRGMNRQVDVDGDEPANVAYAWMIDEGFITDPAS